MTPSEQVGRQVRAEREAGGMTQEDLGRVLGDYLGRPWTKQAVSAAERGERDFTAAEILALSVIFDVSPTWLLVPVGESVQFPSGLETPVSSRIPDDAEVVITQASMALSKVDRALIEAFRQLRAERKTREGNDD